MIVTTTPSVQGRRISDYLGIVMGEAVLGRTDLDGIEETDSMSAEALYDKLRTAREDALRRMVVEAKQRGAHGVVGVDIDYQVFGSRLGLLMVSASGTAVQLGL